MSYFLKIHQALFSTSEYLVLSRGDKSFLVIFLVAFFFGGGGGGYGISTFVGYLTHFYSNNQFYFKQFSLT